MRGAIAHTADTVYSSESTPAQQQIARSIFLRLTELGEGTQDTRRRVSIHELLPPGPAEDAEQVQDVLVKLANARLITTSEGMVEVAHEALIREWPQLREWLAQDREGLRLHRNLTEAAGEWERLARDPGALYRGDAPGAGAGMGGGQPAPAQRSGTGLPGGFPRSGRERASGARAPRVARERTRRAIIAGLATGLIVALTLAAFAVLQWRRAEAQRRNAVPAS